MCREEACLSAPQARSEINLAAFASIPLRRVFSFPATVALGLEPDTPGGRFRPKPDMEVAVPFLTSSGGRFADQANQYEARWRLQPSAAAVIIER